MAMRIPTVTGPSVDQQGLPDAYQRAPAALGAAGLEVAREIGQAGQAGGAIADEYQRQRNEFDVVRVDDALDQLKRRRDDLTFGDAGFTRQRGLDALQRPTGRPLADEYGEQLQKSASDLAAGLTDRQKRVFGLRANDVLSTFRGQVMAHEGQQADAYVDSVREGRIANAQNEVGLYWNDPIRIDGALQSIDAAVADLGRRKNLSAEAVEAASRAKTSEAVTIAIGAALEKNDYLSADTLLKRYSDKMTAADLVKARGTVDKHLDAGIAQQVATGVIRQFQPAIQPTDLDRVMGITVAAESGGKRYGANGALLTSPSGARGEMQVLDSTNRDPGFGVRPAADDSPGERARVGRDYLTAMVRRYDGDLGLAWAAYNAGPGKVDEAQIRAGARPGGDWLTFMPAETQAYVKKNLAAYTAGYGAPSAPTLQDVHAAVRARIGDGNPVRLKLALDETTRQFEDAQKAVKQRDDESTAAAQRWLAANGGHFAGLPASLRAALPPGKVDDMLNFSDRVARGEDRTNPAVYQRLSNPDFLRSLTDAQFYSLSTAELSEADRKHFATERGNLMNGAGADKPGDLNSGAVRSLLDTRLRELGLDPNPVHTDQAANMRIGTIRQFVDRSLLNAQAAAGKKFTDAEVQKHVDGLFAQTDVLSGFFSNSSAPMLTMEAGDIPGAVRDRLKADFKAAGISDPTDGQILGAYWQAKKAAQQFKRVVPLTAKK